MRGRYLAARGRAARSRLLDEYCATTGSHRQAAIRRLRAVPRGGSRRPGRPVRYGRGLLPVLERAWLASQQLSGKLLRPVLPALLTALQVPHGVAIPSAVAEALTTASAATLDRLLRPLRRRRGRQPRRVSTALTEVRAQVPLRTWSEWRGIAPGRCKVISSCTAVRQRPAGTAPPSSPSTSRRPGRSCSRCGICTISG